MTVEPKIIAIVGSVIALVGMYLPAMNNGMGGSANLFDAPASQSLLLIALIIASFVLALVGKVRETVWSGGGLIVASLFFMFNTYQNIEAGNAAVMGELGEITNQLLGDHMRASLSWGWAPLFLGAVAITVAGYLARRPVSEKF